MSVCPICGVIYEGFDTASGGPWFPPCPNGHTFWEQVAYADKQSIGEDRGGMMREIKFRAIEFATDEWVIGSLTPQDSEVSLAIFFANISTGRFDIKTLGQYTGLKDKNGKEIYEGDIVRYQCNSASSNEDKTFAVDEVIFTRGGFACKRTFGELWGKGNGCTEEGQLLEVEVIGNIHENPELL